MEPCSLPCPRDVRLKLNNILHKLSWIQSLTMHCAAHGLDHRVFASN